MKTKPNQNIKKKPQLPNKHNPSHLYTFLTITTLGTGLDPLLQ